MYISWDQGQDPEWEKNDMFSKLDLNDMISLKILIKGLRRLLTGHSAWYVNMRIWVWIPRAFVKGRCGGMHL